MREVTGCPIKFVGIGEKLSEFQEFHPERIASRILNMGDIVSLVEKAAEVVDQEEAEKMAKKMERGSFDLGDMLSQIRSIKKMGGAGELLSMIPGMGKLKEKLAGANIDDTIVKKQEAIILSMTKQERKYYKLINGSRKKRIAAGAGVEVQDVNRLIKQYRDTMKMMKKFSKMDKKSMMRMGLNKLMN
jgi:signal recognition particle subunit SRP54